jgi:hypothetical protein
MISWNESVQLNYANLFVFLQTLLERNLFMQSNVNVPFLF